MIILKNDFYNSFAGAVKSGDDRLVKNLTMNQLSDLVAYDEKTVIETMRKVGVAVPPNASDKEIVKALVNNLKHNAKLRAGIAFLIADNNDLLTLKGKSGADGKGKKTNKKALVQVVRNIEDGFSSFAGELGDENVKSDVENELNNAVENKVKTSGINKPNNNKEAAVKKSNNFHWWFLGGLAVVVGGAVLIGYIRKRNKAKALLAAGGSAGVPPVVPPTTNPPPSPQATPPVQSAVPPVQTAAPVTTPPVTTAPTV